MRALSASWVLLPQWHSPHLRRHQPQKPALTLHVSRLHGNRSPSPRIGLKA